MDCGKTAQRLCLGCEAQWFFTHSPFRAKEKGTVIQREMCSKYTSKGFEHLVGRLVHGETFIRSIPVSK